MRRVSQTASDAGTSVRARPALAVWGALVVATGAVGCALLLDASTAPGEHCRFEGDDTACGLCLKSTCQAAIDACCGNAACAPALDDLDRCAGSADVASCQALPVSADMGGLLGCVALCEDACINANVPAGPSCEVGATSCSCKVGTSDTSNAPCDTGTFSGAICCADIGYPGEGLSCACGAFRCEHTEDGCFCALGGSGSSDSCSGSTCCGSYPDECRCGDASCDGLEGLVFECGVSAGATACSDGRSQVSSCSDP